MRLSWKQAWFLAAALAPAFGMGALNPSITVRDILPAEMKSVPGIGGIGLLPNGDGVVCTWGGSQKSNGEVWIIPALATGNPGVPTRIATGLREALGLAVVGGDFYVLEKPRILKFTGSGTAWTRTTFFSLGTDWYVDTQWHHFSFDLVYHDNSLWFTTSSAYPYDPTESKQRGALIRVPLDGSGYKQMARGFYAANGIGIGPEGEIFVTDNQGFWKPVNALYRIPVSGGLPAGGRFYGYRKNSNNACGVRPPAVDGSSCPDDPEYPPAIWLPYNSYSNCPTRPILLKEGPYAGQMIAGDITHGGILRLQVEKVNGEWQGAAFTFQAGGGNDFGIHQFQYAPSGGILVAGIGGGAEGLGGDVNWNWRNAVRGLSLASPAAVPVFDLLAIRSLKDGFDVEFTQPASSAAGIASNWSLTSTVYTPVLEYGGDSLRKDNDVPVEITSATLSADGRHVRLKLASLPTRRMYAIRVDGAASAAGGQAPFTNVGYYTLNSASPDTAIATRLAGPGSGLIRPRRASVRQGRIAFDLPFHGPWKIELLGPDGARLARAQGSGPCRYESAPLTPGLYLIAGRAEGAAFTDKVLIR